MPIVVAVVLLLLVVKIVMETPLARGHRSWIVQHWMGLESHGDEPEAVSAIQDAASARRQDDNTHARPPGDNRLRGVQTKFTIAPAPKATLGGVHRYATQFGVVQGTRGVGDIFAIRATCERPDGGVVTIGERTGGGDSDEVEPENADTERKRTRATTYAVRRMDGSTAAGDTGAGVLIILYPHESDIGVGGAVCVVSCSVL